MAAGARRAPACRSLGLSVRTVARWRAGATDDQRQGPHTPPANTLTPAERATRLTTVNHAPYADLSPNQIVPRLADAGQYLASESTIYRVLREEHPLAHRGRAAAPQRRTPPSHAATGPNQGWSWGITYLKTPVRGTFWYLYLIVDIWSRKLVGWRVETTESSAHAATLFAATGTAARLDPAGIVLYADNGGPMQGATMLATLERLGVLASFSRPGVSNDNPYSAAIFRTRKYRPAFPREPLADLATTPAWVRPSWGGTTRCTDTAPSASSRRRSGMRGRTSPSWSSGTWSMLRRRPAILPAGAARRGTGRPSRRCGSARRTAPLWSSDTSSAYDNYLDTHRGRLLATGSAGRSLVRRQSRQRLRWFSPLVSASFSHGRDEGRGCQVAARGRSCGAWFCRTTSAFRRLFCASSRPALARREETTETGRWARASSRPRRDACRLLRPADGERGDFRRATGLPTRQAAIGFGRPALPAARQSPIRDLQPVVRVPSTLCPSAVWYSVATVLGRRGGLGDC